MMSNTISNPVNPFHSQRRDISSSGPKLQQNFTFQQAVTQINDSRIEFVTGEGDLVSLTNSLAMSTSMVGGQWTLPTGHGQEFTMASLQTENLALTVQGDLNEQELADIKRLVTDLTGIASTFFAGDAEKALASAGSLGDLGSISSLSATFLQASSAATYYTSYHPVPQLQMTDDLQELFDRFLPENSPEVNYEEALQARWQQVLAMLDAPGAEDEIETASPADQGMTELSQTAEQAAGQMEARLGETMSEHPRLSPFTAPLVMKALDKAFESSSEARRESKELAQAMKRLQHHLFKQLQDWLKPERQDFIQKEIPPSSGLESV
jgi:hypothetical protein